MVMLQNFPVETVVGSHLKAAVTMKALNGYNWKLFFFLHLLFIYHLYFLDLLYFL